MTSSETFNYKRFLEELKQIGREKSGKLEPKYLSLINVLEFDIQPDFLQKVRTGYTPSSFDVQRFKKRLVKLQRQGKDHGKKLQEKFLPNDPLEPRQRDVMELEDHEIIDFTRTQDPEGEFLELYSQLDMTQDFFGNMPPDRILELMNQKFNETIPEELNIPPDLPVPPSVETSK